MLRRSSDDKSIIGAQVFRRDHFGRVGEPLRHKFGIQSAFVFAPFQLRRLQGAASASWFRGSRGRSIGRFRTADSRVSGGIGPASINVALPRLLEHGHVEMLGFLRLRFAIATLPCEIRLPSFHYHKLERC